MILRFPSLVGLAVIFVACRTSGEPATLAPQDDRAGALRAAIGSIFESSSLLVLGEVHGTNEAPRFALAAVEAAVAAGHRVALGLEVSDVNQQAFDRYLASPGGEADRVALAGADHWEAAAPDGRGSRAMLELIEGMGRLRMAGHDVSVHCFIRSGSFGDVAQHEMGMADSVIELLEDGRPRKLVVLVGNVHASTHAYGDPATLPMGQHLLQDRPGMVNLNLRTAGGASWCWTDAPGIHPMGGTGDSNAYGIELFNEPDGSGFRGVFDVGAVTASLPVKPGAVERLMKSLNVEPGR